MTTIDAIINSSLNEFIGRCMIPEWICDESVKDDHSQDVYYTLASIQGAYEMGELLKEKLNESEISV